MGPHRRPAGVQMRVKGRNQREPKLGDVVRKGAQPAEPRLGQVGTGHHHQGEVGIALGAPGRQGHVLKPDPAPRKPGGVVKEGAPIGKGRVRGLKPSPAQIGKAAQSQKLHAHQPPRPSRLSRRIE